MVTHRGPNSGTGHNNGKHIKKKRRNPFRMSRKTLYRLTISLWLCAAFTGGAITELLIDRLG